MKTDFEVKCANLDRDMITKITIKPFMHSEIKLHVTVLFLFCRVSSMNEGDVFCSIKHGWWCKGT